MIAISIVCFISLLLSTPGYSTEDSISTAEAKGFLEERMPESFPGQDIPIHEKNISVKKINGAQAICYSNECWPVMKVEKKISDTAANAAIRLGKVRVEFSVTEADELNPKIRHIAKRSFATDISNIVYIADILRYLHGYRQYLTCRDFLYHYQC